MARLRVELLLIAGSLVAAAVAFAFSSEGGGDDTYRTTRELIDLHRTEGLHAGALPKTEAYGILTLIGGLVLIIYKAGVARLDHQGQDIDAMRMAVASLGVEIGGVRADLKELRGEMTSESRWLRSAYQQTQSAILDAHKNNLALLEEVNRRRAEKDQPPIRFESPPPGHPAAGGQ